MRRAGFTLIELILVLAILVMMVALVVPSLARSSRQRTLEQEALRLVALTEYGRDEAVSTGVAMAVYIDAETREYGVEPASEASEVEASARRFTLPEDLRFQQIEGATQETGGRVATLTPEGVLAEGSVTAIEIANDSGNALRVARQSNGWGYEIVTEAAR